jgi:hypothetical protein
MLRYGCGAAAVHTSRRNVTRGASSHPRRCACSVRAGVPAPSRHVWAAEPRCDPPVRSPATRTASPPQGTPRERGRSHSRPSAAHGPAGPASPRYGCDPARAGPPPTAPRVRHPASRAQSGPIPPQQPEPTPHPTGASPPASPGWSNATPASRGQSRTSPQSAELAARSADAGRESHLPGAPAPTRLDHRTQQPGADPCAHSPGQARTSNTADVRHPLPA